MGTRNLGVAGNSNRILKIFMDGPADHLCLCNDDLLVDGDFVELYAKAHQDLGVGMFCFCVAGNTPLLTRNGITTLEDACGRTVEIWNGQRWAKVVPKKTGCNQKLWRVALSDGSCLDCTDYHGFSVKKVWEKEFKRVPAHQLVRGLQCEPFVMHKEGGTQHPDAYTLGFAVGDGHWAKATNSNKVVYNYTHIYLYGEKEKCPVRGKRYAEPNQKRVRVVTDLDPAHLQALKDTPEAVDSLFSWDRESIAAFIAGLADADGTVTQCGSLRLTVSQQARALRLQLLLRSVGIRASIGSDRKTGTPTSKGCLHRDLYWVQIAECADIPCHRLSTRQAHAPRTRQTVKSVTALSGQHDVYCFTEPETHKAVFANVLTFQCDFDKASPAISGHPESYRWTVYPWRGYRLKFLPRFTGIMISVTRSLLEKIGYFDAAFGQFGEEHCDFTIRARMAGGIQIDKQDMNCLDVEHALLRHQDVGSSVVGGARQRANQEAAAIMEQCNSGYRNRHYYRPFRLKLPRMGGGYRGGGIPVSNLLACGYQLVTELV